MKALRVDRSTGRFMLARLVSGIDTGTAAKIGPLTLTNCEPPALVNIHFSLAFAVATLPLWKATHLLILNIG